MGDTDHGRDPFGDDIVTSPRTIERAVESLNKGPLDRLVSAFRRVTSAPVPRLGHDRSALLVLSPQPGYGKSHLLGRLFRELDDGATLLYLRPFQDPSSCWVAILEKIVTELDHPDAADKLKADPGEPTQLDTLVRHVLLAVMGAILQDDQVNLPNKRSAQRLFERFPQTALETQSFRDWLQNERETILAAVDRLLRGHGIELSPSRTTWVKVLLAYAYSEANPELRQLCLDWLTYRPLDPEEGRLLGLRRGELPDVDPPYEQRNEKCFERLANLFAIGAFYRPFLLCFDQTELYGSSPTLARSFGVVISRLRRETCNQLVVVTANSAVWQERVYRHFEVADRHAFEAKPVELDGIRREQAEELLRNRFARWEIDDDPIAFSNRVLPELFKEHDRRSVRDVLRRARSAWEPGPAADIGEIFESYRLKLLATPKGLDFDPGVVQWAVENVLGPALSVRVEQLRTPRGYFTVQWYNGTLQRELFGFEGGSHWKRWEAIVREANAYHIDAQPKQKVRATLFRFPKQRSLPERTIAAVRKHAGAVRVVALDLEQAADLFAAHDFVADIQQGNQDLGESEVLGFLRTRLRALAEQIWAGRPSTRPPPPNGPLSEEIKRIVQAKRFVTLALLRASLTEPFAKHTDEALVSAAATVDAIKVHIAPGSKLFQWLR